MAAASPRQLSFLEVYENNAYEIQKDLIRLSGLKPDIDIVIEYTGRCPGEKLYEEKLMNEEGMRKTPNDLIFIGSPISFDTDCS